MTTAVTTEPKLPSRLDVLSSLLREHLTFDATMSPDGVTSSVQAMFKRGSVGVGLDVPSLTAPSMPSTATSRGFQVARIGYGLFLGQPPMPRAEVFPYRDYISAKPSLSPRGAQVGINATFFVTSKLGIRFDVSGGGAAFAGVSLVYRPRW